MTTPRATRVLGLDPGSLKAGWGVVDVGEGGRALSHVDNGVIVLDTRLELPARIAQLSRALTEVVEQHRPDVAAVEDVFVNRGARSALILGQARGAVLATLALRGLPVVSHATARVKARVTGHGRASKEQVAEMVTRLLALGEHPFEDAADALAVALCHALDVRSGDLVPSSTGGPRKKSGGRGRRASLEALARAQGKL